MIQIESLAIPEVKCLTLFHASDTRGEFIKAFNFTYLSSQNIDFQLKESIYSISNLNVLRGMHFHKPPYDHAKIVLCTSGAILDVAMDLRVGSPTYGQSVSQELSFENHKALYIPRGFAHGFLALTPSATTFYFIDGEYVPTADGGVRWDSAGIDWPVIQPIVSERDQSFPTFDHFQSPFHL